MFIQGVPCGLSRHTLNGESILIKRSPTSRLKAFHCASDGHRGSLGRTRRTGKLAVADQPMNGGKRVDCKAIVAVPLSKSLLFIVRAYRDFDRYLFTVYS